MIIDAIRLYSAAESSTPLALYAEFGLNHADTSQSYILQQGWGFDLDEINPYFYGSYGSNDFVAMTPRDRLIVMKIRLNPQIQSDETPSSLRDHLYRLIASGRTGLSEVRLMNGGSPVAYIRGHIKKFEADIFSPDPVIQVSISCPDPMFKSVNPVTPTVTISSGIATITDNVSTAPHGFDMSVTFTTNDANPFILQGKAGTTEWPFRINYDFLTSDRLRIVSYEDQKSVSVLRGSSTIQLMDKIALGQVWPLMFPGVTQLEFPGTVTMYSFQYYQHFWGV